MYVIYFRRSIRGQILETLNHDILALAKKIPAKRPERSMNRLTQNENQTHAHNKKEIILSKVEILVTKKYAEHIWHTEWDVE